MSIKPVLHNMIEQQIRTWEVLDEAVLRLYEVPALLRERFVADASKKPLAYADLQLPIGGGSGGDSQRMLEPKLEARILQAVAVQKNDVVLHIGTGSGFFAALLAHMAARVVSVEMDGALAAAARSRLQELNLENVEVVTGDGLQGRQAAAPYNIIVLTGSLTEVPQVLFDQLAEGGRLLAVLGEQPVMTCRLFEKHGQSILHSDILETCIPPLHDKSQIDVFKF